MQCIERDLLKAQTANSSCKLPKYSANGSSRFTVRTQYITVLLRHMLFKQFTSSAQSSLK